MAYHRCAVCTLPILPAPRYFTDDNEPLLLSRLSDAEYGYLVARGGVGYCERAYGIVYERGTSGEGNRV